ncbi:MAG: mycothiol synthase [Acidimicrobiales bacterium]
MARLVVAHELTAPQIESLSELLAAAGEAMGHSPIGEHKWLELVGKGAGFAAVLAFGERAGRPLGYAQVSRSRTSAACTGAGTGAAPRFAVELVVEPSLANSEAEALGHELLSAAIEIVASRGGGKVKLWVPKPGPGKDALANAAGLAAERDLYQMRRDLPAGLRPEVATRPFSPGRDEQAWLELNNRAFSGHPEQGGWDLATLLRREQEPWFDPAGFLLHEVGGVLAGFCWTKVHPAGAGPAYHAGAGPVHPAAPGPLQPPGRAVMGEIYVIAVDPAHRGSGLGRQLLAAGLQALERAGARVAMLYVDAANRTAVELYCRVGFRVDHVDRAYAGEVPASPPAQAEAR